MISKTIHPASRVGGVVDVPGDKSISHRAVILGALSITPCAVTHFLTAEDCMRTLQAFQQMGVDIRQADGQLRIFGKGLEGLRAPAGAIDCGNSGTTARLLMGVLTGQPFDADLIGDASLSSRPMDRVIEPLSKMGAFFKPLGKLPNHLPMRIHGAHTVKPIQWKSPAASAQVKSAILLAGLYASGITEIEEPMLSRDHTERMLKASGVSVERRDLTVAVHGTATIHASQFVVPGDLSSAAFLLAAGVLLAAEELVVRGVGVNPTRAGFLQALKGMGAKIRQIHSTERAGEPLADLGVKKSALKASTMKGALIPLAIDEIPILTVLATQARGETLIADAEELRVKESDRLATLQEELSKMGAQISERPDGLVICGPTPLRGAVVSSHGDHRLAMSLAVAALAASGPTTIEDISCVATSFPTFWELLEGIRER